MNAGHMTVQLSIDRWIEQLEGLFKQIETNAKATNWHASYGSKEIKEDPNGIGAISYNAPVLELKRIGEVTKKEERVIFEPYHRFTALAAGRIDVISYPALRELMLLRTPKIENANELTYEQIEDEVAKAPWVFYTTERIPLRVGPLDAEEFNRLLDDLTS